jgi:hypothetical protein
VSTKRYTLTLARLSGESTSTYSTEANPYSESSGELGSRRPPQG